MVPRLPLPARVHAVPYVRFVALLGAFVLGVLSMVGMPASASAAPTEECSCQPGNFNQLLKQADTVMVATVEHVRPIETEVEGAPAEAEEAMRVVARRVFKGELEQARVEVTSNNSGSCGWYDAESDERLLLMVRDGHVDLCTGSRPAGTQAVHRVQRQLGVGERMAAPPPREATRTKVETEEPLDFARLAAPGGAMVLLGLLGLAVVSRLNRP